MQIADRICDEIVDLRYPENERIPSVRDYCALVEVNVNTANRAYDFLLQQGVLYNKRGIGYFVSKGAVALILNFRRNSFLNTDVPEFFRQMDQLSVSIDDIVEMYRQHTSGAV